MSTMPTMSSSLLLSYNNDPCWVSLGATKRFIHHHDGEHSNNKNNNTSDKQSHNEVPLPPDPSPKETVTATVVPTVDTEEYDDQDKDDDNHVHDDPYYENNNEGAQWDLEFWLRDFLQGSLDDDNDDDDHNHDDDDDDDNIKHDPVITYRRIIDTARLAVEQAYEDHNAMVGSLAEAGGIDDASDAWLQGVLVLLRPHLPAWWWWWCNNDKDDDKKRHEQELWKLAHNRHDDYFIKRSINLDQVKQQMDPADFAMLEMVVQQMLQAVVTAATRNLNNNTDEHHDDDNNDNDASPTFFDIDAATLTQIQHLWGPEIMQELTRQTAQQEREMQQMQNQGMISKMEPGEWWGPATDQDPQPAYERLLTATRRGSLMAHEQRAEFVGALADALQSHDDHYHYDGMDFDEDDNNEDNSGREGHVEDNNGDKDNDDDLDKKTDDTDSSDDSDTDDNEDGKTESENDSDTERENDKDNDQDDNEKDQDDDDEFNTNNMDEIQNENDTHYVPTELGPHAEEHMQNFLQELKIANQLPPWWNEEHEEALWALASDINGDHFLGYPLDDEELKQKYEDAGVRRKISALAEAAAAPMGEEANADPMSNMDDLMKNFGQDQMSKMKDLMKDLGQDEKESSSTHEKSTK